MNSQELLKTVVNGSLKKVPVVRPGYTVRVHQKIKEGGKERIQKFQGLVIKVNSGSGTDKTFTVRGTYSGVGVEKIFPLHSKNISKIEIVKKAKVRRAKLYYMRELTGRAARLQEQYVTDEDIIIDKDAPAEPEQSEGSSDDKKEEDDKGTDEIKADKDEKAEEAKGEEKAEKKEEKGEAPKEEPKEQNMSEANVPKAESSEKEEKKVDEKKEEKAEAPKEEPKN